MPLLTRTYRRLLARRPVTGLFLRQIPSTPPTVSPSGLSSLPLSSKSTPTPPDDTAPQTPRFFHRKKISQKRPISSFLFPQQSSTTKAILPSLHGGRTSLRIISGTTSSIRPFHSSISRLFAEKDTTSSEEGVKNDVKETTVSEKGDSSNKDDAPEAPLASGGEAEAVGPSDSPPPPPSEAATPAATEDKDEATSKVGDVSPTEETSEAGPATEEGPSSIVTEDTDEADDEVRATDVSYAFTPPPPLSAESQAKVDGLLERILWLDMIEVHLLTQLVHEQMGVSWQEAQMGMTGGGGGGAVKAAGGQDSEAAAPEEAKTIFDLKLVGFDAKAKIKVIKEVRTIAGLGLKEAKDMVEAAPKVIQKELKLEKAEELKAQLEAVGAEVELV